MVRALQLTIAAAMILCGSGCATILTGTTQKVWFESDPPGATVTARSGETVVTPGYLELRKARKEWVDVALEGHLPVRQRVKRSVQWIVLGDVFAFIVPGLIIDFLTGGAYALEERVALTLEPDGSAPPEAAPPVEPPPEEAPPDDPPPPDTGPEDTVP